MHTPTPRPGLTMLAAAALVAATGNPAVAADEPGPTVPFVQILNGQFAFTPLPGKAMIETSDYGYIYKAGKQNSHLTVTEVSAGLRFVDTGTGEWKSMPDSCRRQAVPVGIAAVCSVRSDTSASDPTLVEIWPRLGDDYVDSSTLRPAFQVTVLGDAGRDTAHFGAGRNFFNGAMDADVVTDVGGSDWFRTGPANDDIDGGPGIDKLVGADGADTITGGAGADRIYGSAGNDALHADDYEADLANCGGGSDSVIADSGDRVRECETRTVG